MTRIYQTIIVTLALLFSIQGAQAVTDPPPDPDFTFSEPLSSGVTYNAELPILQNPNKDTGEIDDRVNWFQFTLDSVANVSLHTDSSQDTDTILALFDDDTAGTLLGQNDDCDTAPENEYWSCLTYANLGIGTYLAGITSFAIAGINEPFDDGWSLGGNNGNISGQYAELTIEINPVPIPAAIWLFGTALIGFVGMSRRTSVKA